MSRGGRRRRGKRRPAGQRPPATGVEANDAGSATAASQRRRRRRRGRGGITEAAAVAAMSSKQQTLKTLPEDGVVLEELVASMVSEYGPPTTPQEYRLLIKVPGAEDSSQVAKETLRLDPPDVEERVESDGQPATPRPKRRRGRRRRRRMTLDELEMPGPAIDAESADSDAYEEMEAIGPSVDEDPEEYKVSSDLSDTVE